MIAEVSILVILILIVTLIGKTGIFKRQRLPDIQVEAFSNNTELHTKDGKKPGEIIDLHEERGKLLNALNFAQMSNHNDPTNPSKSVIRVGMERMIAEIDRALETDGRFVDQSSVEAIIRASRQSFRPS